MDNTFLDLQNSSYPTQPHSITAKCYKTRYSSILIGFRVRSIREQSTIDVIISKLFYLCLKMAESFENLGNI